MKGLGWRMELLTIWTILVETWTYTLTSESFWQLICPSYAKLLKATHRTCQVSIGCHACFPEPLSLKAPETMDLEWPQSSGHSNGMHGMEPGLLLTWNVHLWTRMTILTILYWLLPDLNWRHWRPWTWGTKWISESAYIITPECDQCSWESPKCQAQNLRCCESPDSPSWSLSSIKAQPGYGTSLQPKELNSALMSCRAWHPAYLPKKSCGHRLVSADATSD